MRKEIHNANIRHLPTMILLSFTIILTTVSSQKSKDLCHPFCHNGKNCGWKPCSQCDFYCGGTCDFVDNSECRQWCRMEDCDDLVCRECLICKKEASNKCPLGSFVDATEYMFPIADSYWYQLTHSGSPYNHEGSPLFVDINDDGVLDYFNSMHGHKLDENGYERMELAESVSKSFMKDNINVTNGNAYNLQRLRHVSERIIINDPDGFALDTHGQNVADLDGDGFNDILIASGGNEGVEVGEHKRFERSTFLLWGEQGNDELTGENTTLFRGGRETAIAAGVDMENGRGRINYLLDANHDGKLDIFFLQDRHATNEVNPGRLMINQGNRTWEEDGMAEFTRTMILTDADGDGFAQEILLNRGFCFPKSSTIPFSDEVKKFCSTRPVGSTAVYKFNRELNRMEELSEKYYNIKQRKQPACCPNGLYNGDNNCNAVSIASADFDGDLLADHVILYRKKMQLHYSSDRLKGDLPVNRRTYEVIFPTSCGDAQSVRVIDLNNDGTNEIIIMCKTPGIFLVYTKGNTKRDWSLDNGCNNNGSLGALNDVNLSSFDEKSLQKTCSWKNKRSWPKLKKICNDYEQKKMMPKPKTSGLCLVDLNNDGFLDAVVTFNFGTLKFFINEPSEVSKRNQYISFRLKGDGKKVNQYGIGATVILRSKKDGKIIQQFHEVSSYQHTSDKYGCKEDRIIFGLGQDMKPFKVIVAWPNGRKQRYQIDIIYSNPVELVFAPKVKKTS